MDEPEPPHAGKPLTREDVVRLTEEHGGPEGLDLSQANLEKADLLGLDLHGASLFVANLWKADLRLANLQGANLRLADLRRASLAYAELQAAKLEGVNWGDHVLGDEIEGDFEGAATAYRALKQWHTEAGMYDIAGVFFYREMEARRKAARDHVYGWLRSARRVGHGRVKSLTRGLYAASAASVGFGRQLVELLVGLLMRRLRK
jgi:hypothetical protein